MKERVIVVGVNGSASSVAALRWAAEQADARDASLRAVYVYDPLQLVDSLVSADRTEIEMAARGVAGRWVAAALGERSAGQVQVDAIAGDPGPVLVAAASQADLLVLGVRAYGRHNYLAVPKIARFCLGRSRAPVVTVPAPVPVEAARSA